MMVLKPRVLNNQVRLLQWIVDYIYIISYSAAKGLVTKRQPIMVDGKETTGLKQAGMITSIDR
jgi:hypothetical protein